MSICIFGDSITTGSADAEQAGWATRLKIHFAKIDNEISVHNLGIPNETTVNLIKRINLEAAAREPEIIVFAIGINDSRFLQSKKNNEVPLLDFKANLKKLHTIARKYTKKIVYIGLTRVVESKTAPIPWKKDEFYTNQCIQQYDEAIRVFCTANNVHFISMKGVIKDTELPDGLHPNLKGHAKMFKKIVKVIDKMVK